MVYLVYLFGSKVKFLVVAMFIKWVWWCCESLMWRYNPGWTWEDPDSMSQKDLGYTYGIMIIISMENKKTEKRKYIIRKMSMLKKKTMGEECGQPLESLKKTDWTRSRYRKTQIPLWPLWLLNKDRSTRLDCLESTFAVSLVLLSLLSKSAPEGLAFVCSSWLPWDSPGRRSAPTSPHTHAVHLDVHS